MKRFLENIYVFRNIFLRNVLCVVTGKQKLTVEIIIIIVCSLSNTIVMIFKKPYFNNINWKKVNDEDRHGIYLDTKPILLTVITRKMCFSVNR